MTNGSEFDNHPDAELGRVLRDHLDGPDPLRFLARLRETIRLAERDSAWDILGRWALPGLVAAGIAAAALAWVGLDRTPGPVGPERVPVQVIVAGEQTAGDLLVAAVLEGR